MIHHAIVDLWICNHEAGCSRCETQGVTTIRGGGYGGKPVLRVRSNFLGGLRMFSCHDLMLWD